MTASRTIARKTVDSDPFGFAQLRQEGIEISQALSGAGWTDYNFHDPGVTILEQVCFTLTDLIYRSSFDVADYLCNQDGEIDTGKMALHDPQDVFFSRPVTPLDYQKGLVDWSGAITDSSVHGGNAASGANYGLYQLQVRGGLDRNGQIIPEEELIEQAEINFHRHRNLCEDLEADVEVIREIECELQAEINLKPGFNGARVLAEVFFLATKELAKEITYQSFSSGLESGKGLDEILQGPFTRNGLIADDVFFDAKSGRDSGLRESAILSAVKSVEGIDYISALRLRPKNSASANSAMRGNYSYRLIEPRSVADTQQIRLQSSGRSIAFSMDEFTAQLETLRYTSSNKTYRIDNDIQLSERPKGKHREIERYQSLQNHFPNAYGINQFGVPDSYPPERKAQALQLKTYLLLFEQLMANYLANLGGIKQLFSIDGKDRDSYFAGVIPEAEVSSLAKVYPENAEAVLDDILGKIDDFIGRKNRLLDYLLALYGEEFNQEQLRNVDFYHSEKELDRQLILNKIRLLNRIKFASGDRGGAVNINQNSHASVDPIEDESASKESLQSVSGLQYRVSIFLGFKYLTPRSLVQQAFRHELTISSSDSRSASDDAFIKEARELSGQGIGEQDSDERYDQIVRSTLREFPGLSRGELNEVILRQGIKDENYVTRENSLLLNLSGAGSEDEESTIRQVELLRNRSAEEIKRHQRFLRRYLLHLSKETEGMHVVEHILLRPTAFMQKQHEFRAKFANRISVIFPAWTARCNDPQFRSLAEELVRQNCPAHICPEIYWLDFKDMCRFEVLQNNWRILLASGARRSNPDALDLASGEILRFLELQRASWGSFREFGGRFTALKETIDQRLAHFIELLYHRRKELQFSPRREEDEELAYLHGIEALQVELKSLGMYSVQHMRLLPAADEIAADDWEFHLAKISVVLPKLRSFRAGSEQHRHFHRVQTIVEDTIREAADARWTLNFHWLVAADMKRFKQVYKRWQEAGGQLDSSQTRPGQEAKRLQEILLVLEQNLAITSDTHTWAEVLGDS